MKADKKKMLFIGVCLIILISFFLAGITSCDASNKDKAVSDAQDVKVAAKVTDKPKEKTEASESSSRKSSPLKSEEKSSSSSGSSSGNSGSSKPSHQHSFTPHYATGYKMETYQYTVYYCSLHNMEFSSLEAADSHFTNCFEQGDPCGYKPITKTGTKQVPYQYIDYYSCSCGAKK